MLFAVQMMSFNDIVSYMQQYGIYDVVLPFLLIFAIMFAVLEKTKIFGENKTNINSIIALVIGLLLVAQKSIVDTILTFLPRAALIMVVILMYLLLLSMVAGQEQGYKGLQKIPLGIAMVVILVAVIIALSPSINISQETRDALLRFGIPLGVLFGLIFLITRKSEPDASKKYGLGKFLEDIGGGLKE